MTIRPSQSSLTALVEQAGRDLEAASGGAAVCALSRAGTPVPRVKYHEGRWAALTEVKRHCRRASEDVECAAVRVHRLWRADLDLLRSRGAGADWIAYRTGGLDALAELTPPTAGGAQP